MRLRMINQHHYCTALRVLIRRRVIRVSSCCVKTVRDSIQVMRFAWELTVNRCEAWRK